MIEFNELRITPDNKCLIIDVSIENNPYFKNVTIESILLDTLDTWVETGPSSKALTLYQQSDENKKAHIKLEIEMKQLHIMCPDMAKYNMFFVYVFADVSKAPEYTLAPCSCSLELIVKTVINLYPIYQMLMAGIRLIENDCSIPKNFINNYLLLQAVNASLISGNYPLAIKYWNMFFNNIPKLINHKSCGCHG